MDGGMEGKEGREGGREGGRGSSLPFCHPWLGPVGLGQRAHDLRVFSDECRRDDVLLAGQREGERGKRGREGGRESVMTKKEGRGRGREGRREWAVSIQVSA